MAQYDGNRLAQHQEIRQLGLQANVGVQITRNFSLEVGYTEMNTSGKTPVTVNGQEVGKADLDAKLSGAEIGLTGTF